MIFINTSSYDVAEGTDFRTRGSWRRQPARAQELVMFIAAGTQLSAFIWKLV